ncbi:MAG: alpha/beta hydrolase [Leptospiraceae bacterium]|nr:alpha/beta hydrolase [Leptospiraceae bacterium]
MDSYNYISIGKNRIAYKQRGKGKKVILIHGVLSYSFLWDEVIEDLVDEFELIAVDLLGCGNSDKPKGVDYSIVAQAEMLKNLILQLEIAPLHLIGHDVGGGISQILATKYPKLFIDLTLINSVGYGYWPVQPITTMRLPIIRRLTSSIVNPTLLKMVLGRAIYHKERLTPQLINKFWYPFQTPEGKAGFVQLIKCINNRMLIEITQNLRNLKLSTLIIRGDADAYLSRNISQELVKDIPNSRFEVVPFAGHFIQIDEPKLISRLMREFMNEYK